MPTALKITLSNLPDLKLFAERLQRPRPLLEAAAKAIEVRLQDHFKTLQGQGNKHGWPEHYFWSGATGSVANATAVGEITDTTATINIASREFAQKLYGGTLTPKTAKTLAIPLSAAAYALAGKGTLRESMPAGAFILTTKKGPYLVTNQTMPGRGATARINLVFWFKLILIGICFLAHWMLSLVALR